MSKKKKHRETIGEEKYTRGELSQLARRRMIQKDHGDESKYSRKRKHKGNNYDDYNWHPDNY